MSSPGTPTPQNPQSGPTILLVDDDEQVRSSMAQNLARKGYRVLEARDGNKAEIALRTTTPDLIVTDLIMPDRDGLELMRFLRKHAPSIPVIAMSGGGRIGPADYLEIAKRMGAVRTLEKPFTVQALLAAIQEVLAQRKAG